MSSFYDNSVGEDEFCLVVYGLPEGMGGFGVLRRFLNEKLMLKCYKIMPQPQHTRRPRQEKIHGRALYVYFKTQQLRDRGIKLLTHSRFYAKAVNLQPNRPKRTFEEPKKNTKKRKEEFVTSKRVKLETSKDQMFHIRSLHLPLWNSPYAEQVKYKLEKAKKEIRHICSSLEPVNSNLKSWFVKLSKINGGIPLKTHDMKHVENNYDYYQSNCDFTIGLDKITGERAVGLCTEDDSVSPLEDGLKTIPQVLLPIVNTFETFLKAAGKQIKVCNESYTSGHLKKLNFKVNTKTEQVMMVIVFDAKHMSEAEIEKVVEIITTFYKSEESTPDKISSLYVLIERREKGSVHTSLRHLLGSTSIEENIGDLKFNVTPESYFPPSDLAIELINEAIKDLCDPSKDHLLFDVGRRGIIGLPLAKDFSSITYIEASENLAKEILEEAELNGITNCEVKSKKIDDVLVEAAEDEWKPNVLIIDLSHEILSSEAIKSIKTSPKIDKLIFFTQGRKPTRRELVDLVNKTPDVAEENIFLPTEAYPIDTCPHTLQYEMLIVFERKKLAEANLEETIKNKDEEIKIKDETPVKMEEDEEKTADSKENNTDESKEETSDAKENNGEESPVKTD